MTVLATIVFCVSTAGIGCGDPSFDKTVQYTWEMTIPNCQSMPGLSMMAEELGKHFPGYAVRKWKCEPFDQQRLDTPT